MAFRKIDIDALEEDAFGEDEIDFQEIGELRPLADVEAQVNSRAQEVRSLLQRYVVYFFYFLPCFSTVALFFFVGMDERSCRDDDDIACFLTSGNQVEMRK